MYEVAAPATGQPLCPILEADPTSPRACRPRIAAAPAGPFARRSSIAGRPRPEPPADDPERTYGRLVLAGLLAGA